MPGVILMSKAKYDSLSPEHRKIMDEATAEAVIFANAHYKKDYDNSLETMKKSKIEIIEPDLASFRATAPDTHAALLKEFPMAKPWLDKIKTATAQ